MDGHVARLGDVLRSAAAFAALVLASSLWGSIGAQARPSHQAPPAPAPREHPPARDALRGCHELAPEGATCAAMDGDSTSDGAQRYALCACAQRDVTFHAVIDRQTGVVLHGGDGFPLGADASSCLRTVPTLLELDGVAPRELVVRARGGCGDDDYGDLLWVYALTPDGPHRLLFLTLARLPDPARDGEPLRVVYSPVDQARAQPPPSVQFIERSWGGRLEITRYPAVAYHDEKLAHSIERFACHFRRQQPPRCGREVEPVALREQALDTGSWHRNILLYEALLQREEYLRSRGFVLPPQLRARLRRRVDGGLAAARWASHHNTGTKAGEGAWRSGRSE